MIRRFCAYRLEFKYSYFFTHYWCTLIPALEFSYKTSVNSSTGQAPAMLEAGWNPRLPADKLRKDSIDIHPTASSSNVTAMETGRALPLITNGKSSNT
ncbi:hypothetical protein O181_014272 [Austropuccinia psidii MF-1]|uniref:Uncharacterized protein n=1 Tax=Austropuccinia psidii MF-1 TaxID=1389203 RepID=A0A9Q3C1B7_9BASI|nr:hypothetical protein [Austropuccinia psidii MF-1]